MAIFPKNEHMKVGMYFLSTIGVWPIKFQDHPKIRKLYLIYSNFMFYYFLAFVCRQIVELISLIISGNVTRMMQNCSLTLLCTISAFRSGVVRGKHIKLITDHIIAAEDKIKLCGDDELVEIYNENIKLSQWASKFFIVVGWLTASPFYLGPYAEAKAYPDQYPPDNYTGQIHYRLPLSEWVPYNYTNHYWITYFWQVANGWTAECFVVYTDAFLFGLMIFPVGQMRLLSHIVRNFRKYALKTQKQMDLEYEDAAYATMRACIIFHKEIISYVGTLNTAMRWLMLLDFASCSIQMSVLVFQVIMYDTNVVTMFALEFLISMVIQLFLFYWNANEITVEGLRLSVAIWEGEWYREPQRIKKSWKFMMMRAQKPLTVYIGPFYPMSTETALSILKATYSYAMLIRQSYLQKL